MSEPSDDPPPRAERTHDTEGDSGFDSAGDSRFDSGDTQRRYEEEARRRQRTVMIVVLLVCLMPIAGCGFLFAVCSLFKF